MEKELKVFLKSVYGNDLIYPITENAKLFAELIGKKTFRKHDLEIIKRLGYEVTFSSPDFKL